MISLHLIFIWEIGNRVQSDGHSRTNRKRKEISFSWIQLVVGLGYGGGVCVCVLRQADFHNLSIQAFEQA